MRNVKGIPVDWSESGNAEYPFTAIIEGERWTLRLNDFPDEPMFTLFIDDEEIGSFDDVPPYWRLPA